MSDEQQLHVTWINSRRTVPARFVRPLLRFTHIEASGGIILLIAAVVALLWANAPFGESYEHFWETHLELSIGSFHIEESLRDLVNDGLMAIFFFVVGLEIKRELVLGELRDPKTAALPALAALGGMIVPALIYIAFVGVDGEAGRGWGIPMATDIAFSVGVLALLGRRVPIGAKLFLLALAIVDDIGAILVIAIFYTDDLAFLWLVAALATFGIIWLGKRIGIRSYAFYVPMGLAMWFFMLESGVHATLAGVALGLLTPALPMYSDREYHDRVTRILDRYDFDARAPFGLARVDEDALQVAAIARESVSPLNRLEHSLHPWSSFVVVPIFALANAGVRFIGVDMVEAITHPVALGTGLGLLVGKVVGITGFTWLAVRLKLGRLPRLTTWQHVIGLSAVAGIGFTVALFVDSLAFTDPVLIDLGKVGIFVGSTLAGLLGFFVLRAIDAHPRPGQQSESADASAASSS